MKVLKFGGSSVATVEKIQNGTVYMDWHSWNDFRDDRVWPESMVAMMQEIYDTETYRIRDDYIKT